MTWESDRCWCIATSDECNNVKCSRHLSNKSDDERIFTCSNFMNTEYCPLSTGDKQMERIARVWIDDNFLDLEVEDNYNSEDELYEAVVEYVFNTISIEIIQEGIRICRLLNLLLNFRILLR